MVHYKIIKNDLYKSNWVTLLHGLSQNYNYFNNITGHLVHKFNVLLVDMRGHGNSDNIDGPYGINEYSDDIINVLKKENIKNTHFFGTHTGANVGIFITLNNPELINSLILEGAVIPGKKMNRTSEIIEETSKVARFENIEKALDFWYSNADWFSYMRGNAHKTNAKEHKDLIKRFSGKPWISELKPIEVKDSTNLLKNIEQNVLFYNGEFDMLEFKLISNILSQNLKNPESHVIKNSGSFPLWENPNEVIKIVVDFLNKVCGKDKQVNTV